MINVSYSTSIFDRYLNPQIEGAAVNQGLAPREADPFLDEDLDGDVSEKELEDKVSQYRELYRRQRDLSKTRGPEEAAQNFCRRTGSVRNGGTDLEY